MLAKDQKIEFQLQCPLPQLDFEYITLGHGSGGLLTNQLLNSGVFELLSNPYLDKQHDGAIFKASGELAITTDSFVISPIFFPGGNIGELAVFGTVNDLAMCGAIPKYLTLSFILEEGLAIKEFWDVMLGVKWAANLCGVQIITGDTKVVDRGKGDKIFINTTGIGELIPGASIDANRIEPGDKIIVSGQIATHGMAIMSVREGLEFETTIESDSQPLHKMAENLIRDFKEKVKFLRDPTRGGLGTTLTEMVKSQPFGANIFQDHLPIDNQVANACELLGIDPLYVANEGVFLTVVKADIADAVIEKLKSIEGGHQSVIIGEITSEHPGQAILNSAIGGKRLINMLVGEQLPRIC
ncbi:MAG: hydrogenase expression/formation protein HypE [Cyclobacteriaceae bacterium]